jgi:hypothetical protein
VAVFQPREILRVLSAHRVKYVVIGNLGGALYGSPIVTTDADICPAREKQNLDALAAALNEMGARIRTADVPDGLPFACDAAFLSQMKMVNLTTRFGDVDLSFEPSGTGGYEDLAPRAIQIELRDGVSASIASLEDIIRSKQAANRERDRLALPTLRLLLEAIREQGDSRKKNGV